jgi:hypothetical protein
VQARDREPSLPAAKSRTGEKAQRRNYSSQLPGRHRYKKDPVFAGPYDSGKRRVPRAMQRSTLCEGQNDTWRGVCQVFCVNDLDCVLGFGFVVALGFGFVVALGFAVVVGFWGWSAGEGPFGVHPCIST